MHSRPVHRDDQMTFLITASTTFLFHVGQFSQKSCKTKMLDSVEKVLNANFHLPTPRKNKVEEQIQTTNKLTWLGHYG